MSRAIFIVSVQMEEFMLYIEDIYFLWVNTKYISSSAVKKSVFFRSATSE